MTTRIHILPFRAAKDLAYTPSVIANRFETFLKAIRQKRLNRIESLLKGLEGIGEMTPEAAQELVYDHLNPSDRACLERFDLLDYADTRKIKRRASKIHAARTRGIPELKHISDTEKAQLLLASRGVELRGIVSSGRSDEVMAEVHARMPWMTKVSTHIMHRARAQAKRGRPFHLSPLLLISPPGLGKSTIGPLVAEGFGVPCATIDVGSSGGGIFSLAGAERGWSSAHPGLVVRTILEHQVANPLVIIDEIDKATGSVGTTSGRTIPGPQEALLAMIEPETARRWRCPYFGIEFDLRQVSWILTANSINEISPALLSRCTVIELDRIQVSQVAEITHILASGRISPEIAAFIGKRLTDQARLRKLDLRTINRASQKAEEIAENDKILLH